MERVLKSISSYASLSESEIATFCSKLQGVSYNKGEMFLDIDETNRCWAFIEEGSFREYYVNAEMDEVITNLFPVHTWVLNHESFTGQKPSKVKIEAFEHSEVYQINIYDLHDLIGSSPSYFALGKIIESVNYHTSLRGSPEEKYSNLIQTKPEIIKTFPLKYIASYLGMTPETLSRVRNRMR